MSLMNKRLLLRFFKVFGALYLNVYFSVLLLGGFLLVASVSGAYGFIGLAINSVLLTVLFFFGSSLGYCLARLCGYRGRFL